MFEPDNEPFYPKLQPIIDSAFEHQWLPEKAIDWQLEVKLPDGIDQRTYIDMVSQLYYAEEATIQLLGRMLQEVPELHAKQYLCTQAMDEARHAQVYRSYLARLGDIAPINDGLRYVLDSGLSWRGSHCGLVVALNVVMEGEALRQQQKRIETLPCPLFRAINTAIIRDESRHAKFGRIYTTQTLASVALDDKVAIYRWIKQIWSLWERANQGRYHVDGADILRTESSELQQRLALQQQLFTQIGLFDENNRSAYN